MIADLGAYEHIAVFGGVYNNHLSLSALLRDARDEGCEELFCLGDVGGFGPSPAKSVALLRSEQIPTMLGNYDDSIGNRLEDCQCGYTDPRDNHFARISYEYTLANTPDDQKDWLRDLPTGFRMTMGGQRILMQHGSPRRINEFLWESTTPDAYIARLLDTAETDVLFVTHTGIPWQRWLEDGRGVVNVGAIGRPANDGRTCVWYALARVEEEGLSVQLRPLVYDYQRLAKEMREEELPEEFVETILTGWWTTCLEILPIKERTSGRY